MALLEPDVQAIAPAAPQPARDRAPDRLATGTPETLRADLAALVGPEQVLARATDLVRYASDASPYRRFPQAVVMARDTGDVARLLDFAHRSGTPLTFRSGGTSLNGQSQTDGILVDVRRHWRGVEVEDGGARARVRPGTVLGHVNRILAPLHRRLGPDPASTDIATVGGVVANNSGGMRCGTTKDSYSTVRELTFVLPSGTVVDTGAPGAAEEFARREPELARGLEQIRDEIRADGELTERIRHKFEIKNTMGYRLNAFLDADEPMEIFRRLLVGSEGTLAFIAEAVFETVPVPARTTMSWLHFPGVDETAAPVPDLVAAGARAVELMVAPALIASAHAVPGRPEYWKELPPESAALLVEFGAEDDAGLDAAEARAAEVLDAHELIRPPAFTRDAQDVELYWSVREGMHGLLGRLKPPQAALIIEDVCVPPSRIAEGAKDLMALLSEHGFLPGVAGHASAGNLHFMLTPDLAETSDRDRYEAFMTSLVDLVLDKYDGSLKAEHGTGINMAPFVEREWGTKATELMWRVKALADPDNVLSPGVVLNRDPAIHLKDLKSTPTIEEEANTCVECGFCEPVCPSRDLTTTPRQRIVVRREMARQPAGSPVLAALLREYEYDGLETCAADGSCKLACPVGIDTGKFVKGLRERQHGARSERVALEVARRWALVERGARAALRAGNAAADRLGPGAPAAATRTLRAALGAELVPTWPATMPEAAPATLPATARAGAAAVYLPACINRIFGAAKGRPRALGLPEALVTVSDRAGLPLWIPEDVAGTCCATPWASKGYRAGNAHMANAVVDALWRWTGEGLLPVVVDASSCSLGLLEDVPPHLDEENARRHGELEILDSIEWAHDRLLPRLTVTRRVAAATVHPPCSTRHLGLDGKLEALAGALADEVNVPVAATCCGFAGDRGLLHPELTAAATRDEAAELDGRRFDAHLCSNRTCEIGLQQATGADYASFVYLLEQATRAA
jgi:D-lactate dehydrogenase